MTARPVLDVRCGRCRRWLMVRRLRGGFRGGVQVLGQYDEDGCIRTQQLDALAGDYDLRSLRCQDCAEAAQGSDSSPPLGTPDMTTVAAAESLGVLEHDLIDVLAYLGQAVARLERHQCQLGEDVGAPLAHLARARHEAERAFALLQPALEAASAILLEACCQDGEIPF